MVYFALRRPGAESSWIATTPGGEVEIYRLGRRVWVDLARLRARRLAAGLGASFRWCLGGYCADNLPGDGVRRKLLRWVGEASSGFMARGEPSVLSALLTTNVR
jgi:hypothetical protein